MTRRNIAKRTGTQMSNNFIRNLDKGVILDRSTPGKHKKPKIEAPKVLRGGSVDGR